MKRLLRWTIILGVLIAIGSAIAGPTAAYFREKNRILYREVEAKRGSVVAVVDFHRHGQAGPVGFVGNIHLRADRVDCRGL